MKLKAKVDSKYLLNYIILRVLTILVRIIEELWGNPQEWACWKFR